MRIPYNYKGKVIDLDVTSNLSVSTTLSCCGIREFQGFTRLTLRVNGDFPQYTGIFVNSTDVIINCPLDVVDVLVEKLLRSPPRENKIDVAYIPNTEQYAAAQIAVQLVGFHEVERSKSNHGNYYNIVYMRKGEPKQKVTKVVTKAQPAEAIQEVGRDSNTI